jgi:small subunit ribosomal protein S18
VPFSPFRENRVDGVNIDLSIDYKNVDLLRRCLNQASKILPRRQTGLDAKRQRQLTKELKRARFLALLPYVNKRKR